MIRIADEVIEKVMTSTTWRIKWVSMIQRVHVSDGNNYYLIIAVSALIKSRIGELTQPVPAGKTIVIPVLSLSLPSLVLLSFSFWFPFLSLPSQPFHKYNELLLFSTYNGCNVLCGFLTKRGTLFN